MSDQFEEINQLANFADQNDAGQESEWEAIPEGQEVAEAPEMETSELCTALLSIGFSLVASRRGEHWTLNRTEAEETGKAVGAVLDKYFPDLAATSGVEVTAVMTMGMVVMGRLATDKKVADAKEVKDTPQPTQAAQPTQNKQNDAPEYMGVDLSNVDAA